MQRAENGQRQIIRRSVAVGSEFLVADPTCSSSTRQPPALFALKFNRGCSHADDEAIESYLPPPCLPWRPMQSLNAWNCAPVHPAMLQRFVTGSYLPPFCTAHRHGMLEQPRAQATELVPINDMLMAAVRIKPFQNMVAPLSLDVGIAFGVPGPPSGMGEAAGAVEVDKRMIIPHPPRSGCDERHILARFRGAGRRSNRAGLCCGALGR
jgi:hypothetical protein